jgi:hypothetical protein
MKELMESTSLRGIERLGVLVENPLPQLNQTALHERELKTQIQERLYQAGIEVLPEEYIIANGLPYLYVNINIMNTTMGLYVFATRVSLKQTVLLPREPFSELYTSTWETGGVGTVGVNNVTDVVGSVRQHIDQFCRDYLAENVGLGSCGNSGAGTLKALLPSRQRLCWWREHWPPASSASQNV